MSQTKKSVLDVGNCGPDHSSIRAMLQNNFDVEVRQADATDDALAALEKQPADLILVNRKLDCDYSDGVEVIRAIKSDERFAGIPVMLVTNLDEHQEAAMAIGAERGFGKLALRSPETRERLQRFLA